jgi:hypothetical protein
MRGYSIFLELVLESQLGTVMAYVELDHGVNFLHWGLLLVR